MELGAFPEAGIDYGLHGLPERLQEANPSGVFVNLGDQDQDGPPQLPRYLHDDPHVLDYFHELHPPSRFGGWGRGGRSLSRIVLAEPRLEVLRADVGVSAFPVGAEELDRCLHLRLCWDLINNMEGVNVGGQQSSRGVRVL